MPDFWHATQLKGSFDHKGVLTHILRTMFLLQHDHSSYELRDQRAAYTRCVGVLCICVMASNLGFSVWFLSVYICGSLIFVPSLWLFSSCFYVLSKFDVIVLFSLTIFCFLIFYYYLLKSCLFTKKRQKGNEFRLDRRYGGTWRSTAKEKKHNQYILYVGKYIFNKKKTKRANVSVTRLFTHLPLASWSNNRDPEYYCLYSR